MIDALAYGEVTKWISKWHRPAMISHAKPDGDAIGSLLAMRSLLVHQGVAANAILFDPLPDRYARFKRFAPIAVYKDIISAAPILDTADGLIVLDTCAFSQLDPVADWLRRSPIPKLAIDHHGTRDELADRYLIDESAPATCSVLFDWARAAGWPIDAEAAEALFVGIATDTGWFRHSNTDDRALSACAELAALGVRPDELFESFYLQDSVGRVRLLGQALSTLELHASDRLSIMTLARSAFACAGAKSSDTEDIVNEPLRIASVVVSALLVEQDDGQVRVNLRSKPPRGWASPTDVDVAGIARGFGGGGHRRAAGARTKGTIAEVRKRVLSAIIRAIEAG